MTQESIPEHTTRIRAMAAKLPEDVRGWIEAILDGLISQAARIEALEAENEALRAKVIERALRPGATP